MTTASIAPDDVAIADRGGALRLSFPDRAPITLGAHRLRVACKCAHCQRARIEDRFPNIDPGLTIVDVTPQGHFGLNIAFSDGHARGIYPWVMLYGLRDQSDDVGHV